MNSDIDSQPKAILDEVDRVRRGTRTALHGMWFPLVVFGSLTCLGAGVSWQLGGASLAVYWAVAAPVGSVATGIFYSREQRRVGIEMPSWHWMVGVAVIIVGAFSTGTLGGMLGAEMVSAVGPPLSVSLGYLIFAWIERSPVLATIAVALATLTLAMAISEASPTTVATVLAATYGLVFLVTGLLLMQGQRPRRA